MNGAWGIVGAVISVMGTVTMGVLTYRGTRTAARINAAPTSKQVDLSVLLSSVERLKEECEELRQEQTRTRSILWSISRWALRLRDQVTSLGGTPEAPPQDVEDYYRTGV
ncbi:hypothetical protein LRR80_05391 [Streptomyces sp. RO-S4]|uniref:hypothetical protein n=1 Tax=Streptomyces sp. RO-S4 TaxID=2902486 RepID=UPI00208FF9AA|nr:hypothetical protein [Streptomyces sp. RO-S4]MCO4699297.1 hypothetical protein [Streptomyces sp. RO-S4]